MELRDHLAAAGARPRGRNIGAFELAAAPWWRWPRGEPWAARQARALAALRRAAPGPWFLTLADADAAIPSWAAAGPATWRLPADLRARAVLEQPEVTYGDWVLYAAPSAVVPFDSPDLFRASPEAVRAWTERHHVQVLLASWPDDVEWQLQVLPDLLRMRVDL